MTEKKSTILPFPKPAASTYGTTTIGALNRNEPIDVLRVLSFEAEVYSVEVDIGDRTLLVKADDGSSLMFRSQLAAKKPFKTFDVRRAVLRHQSAYDEMIGIEHGSAGNNRLEVTIALPRDDYS